MMHVLFSDLQWHATLAGWLCFKYFATRPLQLKLSLFLALALMLTWFIIFIFSPDVEVSPWVFLWQSGYCYHMLCCPCQLKFFCCQQIFFSFSPNARGKEFIKIVYIAMLCCHCNYSTCSGCLQWQLFPPSPSLAMWDLFSIAWSLLLRCPHFSCSLPMQMQS